MNEFKRAAELLVQALEVCNEAADRLHLVVCLCDVAYQQGDYEAVMQYNTSMMKLSLQTGICTEDELRAMLLSGKALFYSGDHRSGLERCGEVLTVLRKFLGKDSSIEAETLLTTGILYHTDGQHKHATACLHEQLPIARSRGDRAAQVEGHFNLACVYRDLLEDKQVISHCTQTLDVLETLWCEVETDERRLWYAAKFTGPSRMLVDTLSRVGDVEEALEHAERGRSRALDLLLSRQRLHQS
eukprot:2088372-Prymnesium_polylepis.1